MDPNDIAALQEMAREQGFQFNTEDPDDVATAAEMLGVTLPPPPGQVPETRIEGQVPDTSAADARMRGLGQGATAGLGDELVGFARGRPDISPAQLAANPREATTGRGILSAIQATGVGLPSGISGPVALYRALMQARGAGTYSEERNAERAANARAQAAHPVQYGAAEVAGSAVPAAAMAAVGVPPVAAAAGQGAVGGAGHTDTSDPGELAANSAAGGLLGAGAGLVGRAVPAVAGVLPAGGISFGGIVSGNPMLGMAGAAAVRGLRAVSPAAAARVAGTLGSSAPVAATVRYLGRLSAEVLNSPAAWPQELVQAVQQGGLAAARADYVLQQTNRSYAQQTAGLRAGQ